MYAVIDIESNGGKFREEYIIEVAIYLYDGHNIMDQMISLVKPEEEITPFVQKLTGITNKMVKTAPKFHEMAKRIIEITQNATLVGHNVEFDYRMLRQSFKRLGYDFQMDTLDTIALSKKLIPDAESYSLEKLCKSVGIPHTNVHRASGDARATLELLKILISKDVDNEVLQTHQEETNCNTYQNKIIKLTEDLPSERGIVYFQNKKGKIIFSDYTDNIYKKTKKIFNSKVEKHLKIQQEVEQVHYEFTGTDIIAQLMLKEKRIKYNLFHNYFIVYVEDKREFSISTKKNLNEIRLFGFKYFSQAEKFLAMLQSREKGLKYPNIKKEVSFAKRNEIWIGQGRTMGEKSFLAFRNGRFVGYGFYELYHQVLSWDKIQKIMVPVATLGYALRSEMQIAYLRGDYKVIKIEQK